MSEPVCLVMFACNDPNNGMFVCRCDALHFRTADDETLELDGPEPAPRMSKPTWKGEPAQPRDWSVDTEGAGRIRFGRRWFAVQTWKTWYGNWCWDSARMATPEAERLLEYALDRGFTATGGTIGGPLDEIVRRRVAKGER